MNLPAVIRTEDELDQILTRPTQALIEFIRQVSSPLVILGAAGKMGPSLAVLARRAAEEAGHKLEVIAVSRFSNPAAKAWLETNAVKTHPADLLRRDSLSELPDSPNIIYLVGLKFGTAQNPSATWAMNTVAPANAAERYAGSRIVALSSGNVYPLTEVEAGGSHEIDSTIPLGEYANATVGRERIFEFYSRQNGTPIALIRLFYAVELRYGVLVDIAQMIASGQPIDSTTGYFNCIWQGDANEMIIRSLGLVESPPSRFNLCLPQVFSLRTVAAELGERMGTAPLFKGAESNSALLGDPAEICRLLGHPATPFAHVLNWTADWVKANRRTLGKPTHFEVRDGIY
jgi:nucleoside-diphosphate-sugar epimerase